MSARGDLPREACAPGLRAYLDAADLIEPMRQIAAAFHVPPDLLLTMTRRRPYSLARFAFWWHLHEICGWSHHTIAIQWRCDHSTVHNGIHTHGRSRRAAVEGQPTTEEERTDP